MDAEAEPSKTYWSITRNPKSSSIGLLGELPVEVLLQILYMLDPQALSRLSRTSLRGNAIVR
jgi:hypothetical protein